MRRVCSWCNKDMSPEELKVDGAITHGICSHCAISITSYKPRDVNTLINYIHEPVFVLNSDGRLVTANESGQKMIGKSIEDMFDVLGGDAFECVYAKDSAGCGNTEHCVTCSIRNTVMDTLLTGDSHVKVPAFQKLKTPEGEANLIFTITTELVNGRIMLRIDNVRPNEYQKTISKC